MSTTTSPETPPAVGVIHRLVRKISGRNITSTTPSAPPAETVTETATAPPADEASSPSEAADPPQADSAPPSTDDRSRRRLSLTDKLKQFGRRARSRSKSRDGGDLSISSTTPASPIVNSQPVSAHLRAVTEEPGQAPPADDGDVID
ncbi:hypothetical protein BDN72DRAFT_893561, partial [Pluteus cervinus]